MNANPLLPMKRKPVPRRSSADMASGDFTKTRAEVLSFGLVGIEARLLRVTAETEPGSPAFHIVDVAESRAREIRVRVRSALEVVGVDVANLNLTIRFDAPELVRASADAAIALAIVAVSGRIAPKALAGTAVVGVLDLSGALRDVRGVLPMLQSNAARGLTQVIVPQANAPEASHATGASALVARHLRELVDHFTHGQPLERVGGAQAAPMPSAMPDLSEIRGQHAARRALEVAAAGHHGLLFLGPPGSGKTLLARRLAGILPEPTPEELLEITSIHSVAGLLPLDHGFVTTRPFRAPHHTVSAAGLLGGGDPVRPGEVTLAHHGVLFMDELVEFQGGARESLSRVLLDGHATIVRAGVRTTFPARPLVVAASNLCPCGYAGGIPARCSCSPERIAAYRFRLRQPLTERMDLRIVLPPQDVAELQREGPGEASSQVRARVAAARGAALERARSLGLAPTNANLAAPDLERVATPDAAGTRQLTAAVQRLGLAAWTIARVLRVARTIADLDQSDAVREHHVDEAVSLAVPDLDAVDTTQPATGGTHAG